MSSQRDITMLTRQESQGDVITHLQTTTDEVIVDTKSEAPTIPDSIAQEDYAEDADALENEAAALSGLVTAKDQDQLERDIGRQADQLLTEQADDRDKKRLERTNVQRQRLLTEVKRLNQRLDGPGSSIIKNPIRAEKARQEAQIKELEAELAQINARIEARHNVQDEPAPAGEVQSGRLPDETRREYLIRTGKITPFSKIGSIKASADLADVMLDAEEENDEQPEDDISGLEATSGPRSHQNLKRPGFDDAELSAASTAESTPRHTKRRRIESKQDRSKRQKRETESAGASDDEFNPDLSDHQPATFGETEESEDALDDFEDTPVQTKSRAKKSKKRQIVANEEDEEELANLDDGDERVYQRRIKSWSRRRRAARQQAQRRLAKANGDEDASADTQVEEVDEDESDLLNEAHAPHPTLADADLEGGFRVPGDIFPSLFDYQKTGVRWLWELFQQHVGGIIGDEMGLGKTIQVVSLIAGLHYSEKLTKPIIVVCPATILKQWANEFHRWWPPLRVSILHSSGTGMKNMGREVVEEESDDDMFDGEAKPRRSAKHTSAAQRVVDKVIKDGHVLVTTYSGLQTYSDILLPMEWDYAVLDEGHKIRNPNTSITVHSKMIRTHNRIILSGTPMQNNLTELWSLFDFVFPMRLGTLVSFKQQFEVPIKLGGYANASNLQVETATRCAESLKEAISPYLLQRFKVDVAADLPKKKETVLFCKLTKLQRDAYVQFLSSEDMNSIIQGKRQSLYGIDILRKICNHPDLVDHKHLAKRSSYDYGIPNKSGKMQVIKTLLSIWKTGGHKTLLFAQHRIMLDILEKFISKLPGFNYRRMDGTTSIEQRQNLVDEFNKDPDLHVFLLTTKVGGLGVNLTGADRVIIYDPDWNPSTDVQARERAWRLGQKREVEIYRLMMAGTIEEKIYHRQIFKQFLSNKILRDPKQRQTFHLKDLHDLFTFGDNLDGSTETSSLFKGTEINFDEEPKISDKPLTDDALNGTEQSGTTANDLNTIKGLHHQEAFKAPEPGTSANGTDAEGEEGGSENPDRLLSALFSKSGVTAHDQDAILGTNNGKRKIQADPETIAREARRVADIAARELRQAAEVAKQTPAGVPTWTGVVGTTGRPDDSPRLGRGGMSSRGRGGRGGGALGPSSSSILANLATRQTGSPAPSSRASTPSSLNGRGGRGGRVGAAAGAVSDQQPRGKDFMVLIRDYLRTQGGSAYTQMLIDHFNRFCGTPERTAEFKEMLRLIAELDKGPRGRGRGRWVLKAEWK